MQDNNKKWNLTPLTLANIVVLVFLAGALLSPFTGMFNNSGLIVNANTNNPLDKSDSVKSAVIVQNALREIYKQANPAVVRIETEAEIRVRRHPYFSDPLFRKFFGVPNEGSQTQKRQGLGSGFVISKDGFIVTNHHVIDKMDKITIKFSDGKAHSAKVVGSDANSDIALLKVDDVENLKTIYIGDSDKIEVGDIAIAIGNPFGLSSTFTMGVISSKGQDVEAKDGVPRIQTDAAINPGNSGGPLLTIKGEVIGINQMIYSQSGGSVGIGFAIPMNYAMAIIEKLKTGKKIKPAYIGVSIAPSPTEEQLKELQVTGKTGLLIAQVIIGSPAWKAGIRPYDFITKVEDKVANKFSVLKSTVVRKGVGSKIKLTLIRDGKEKKVILTVGENTQPS